ncbi:MAG: hypothetical protein PHS41_06440 [Victivallaceae bacterium]|nr:hypothetical protein [Victivallaceae bacterium]
MTDASIDLAGQWTLTSPQMPDKSWTATLPGDNYSALLAAGEMPDPYWSDNENAVQHFADCVWEFHRIFEVSQAMLSHAQVFLEMTMVDTFATVTVNGRKCLNTENMFRRYRTDVKKLLKAGDNSIVVTFHPVLAEAEKENREQPFPVVMNSCCTAPHLNLVRKPHCHGGWDWGIKILASGIYDTVRLIAADDLVINAVYTRQEFGKAVVVTAVAQMQCCRACRREVLFRFNGEEKKVRVSFTPGENTVQTSFTVEKPKLWWPNTYGAQPLYLLEISCGISTKMVKIGLRKLEVVNEKDSFGTSLSFRVNGVDIFAKGADWIPCDALPGRQNKERYADLLQSAKDANMNMLRVWGGGQYEKEMFYELCDEKGLLIWQDMMFACSLYPATDKFIENVKSELDYQLPRLRHHASLALWCGDNEVIGATAWYCNNSPAQRTKNVVMYDRLNRELRRKVAALDPDRVFWPSSPCGGPGDFNDGWHNDSQGDMHYWEVWHGGKDFDAYYSVKPRFCSEFGYQSYPSMETVRSFCPEKHFNVFSPSMDHHEKCVKGNAPILGMMGKYFRMPSKFEDFLYLSQVQQALAIKTGVEFWRTTKPRCMGAIYWQLNDNWPVVSWSSLEYSGKWKLLQYQAKKFFAPVIVTAVRNELQEVEIYVCSDLPERVTVEVKAEIRDLSGNILRSIPLHARLAAGESRKIKTLTGKDLTGFRPEEAFLELQLSGPSLHAENTFFFAPYKRCELEEPEIQLTFRDEKDVFVVELRTQKPAFCVAVDANAVVGTFSDNDFTLLPGTPKQLTFVRKEGKSFQEFRDSLQVRHLRGIY